ncbi:hypothetical protein NMQ03_01135 [Arthrobacter sp. DNA4]|uniref:hypothetical protein n=1 Tax=Arthrobacter sp. DNA4 TaxID=2963432 RepID=UPI0020CDBD64|nr:hypothetical protein [Arthrobacter sp. DNA4]UTT69815.1 hypothetical protein NMQ03_01135 [Arthrobacter sp. DNA4]
MNAEPSATGAETDAAAPDGRPDLSNTNVREDLAMVSRCALVHLPTGRTCLLPLRHQGACEFHRPQEAQDIVASSS